MSKSFRRHHIHHINMFHFVPNTSTDIWYLHLFLPSKSGRSYNICIEHSLIWHVRIWNVRPFGNDEPPNPTSFSMISHGFPWSSLTQIWYSHCVSYGFPRISMVFLWFVPWLSYEFYFTCFSCGFSKLFMVFLWFSNGFSRFYMVFSLVFLWFSNGFSRFSMVFLWFPMVFLWFPPLHHVDSVLWLTWRSCRAAFCLRCSSQLSRFRRGSDSSARILTERA